MGGATIAAFLDDVSLLRGPRRRPPCQSLGAARRCWWWMMWR